MSNLIAMISHKFTYFFKKYFFFRNKADECPTWLCWSRNKKSYLWGNKPQKSPSELRSWDVDVSTTFVEVVPQFWRKGPLQSRITKYQSSTRSQKCKGQLWVREIYPWLLRSEIYPWLFEEWAFKGDILMSLPGMTVFCLSRVAGKLLVKNWKTGFSEDAHAMATGNCTTHIFQMTMIMMTMAMIKMMMVMSKGIVAQLEEGSLVVQLAARCYSWGW